MILLYTGRRNVPLHGRVAEEVRDVLTRLRPRLAVGSAAAGTDLVVIGHAVRLGLPVRVVLRGPPGDFARDSVDDMGQEWSALFEELLADDQVTVSVLDVPATDEGYAAVNIEVLETAAALRQSGEEVVVLAVTSPRTSGADHAEGMAAEATRRGWRVIRIPLGLK